MWGKGEDSVSGLHNGELQGEAHPKAARSPEGRVLRGETSPHGLRGHRVRRIRRSVGARGGRDDCRDGATRG